MPTFLERASQAIRDAGGRMTEQRYIVLDVLANLEEPCDAESLLSIARRRDAGINLATIYRTLSVLEAANLVRGYYQSPDHSRKFYEVPRGAPEYHFTCRHCKRVISFHSELTDALKRRLAEELGLSVQEVCLCANGLCTACQAKLADRGCELVDEDPSPQVMPSD